MAYIKLGNIGKSFTSKSLGIYLDRSNATEVNHAVLYDLLINFLFTGFIEQISKLEYDNIKLEQRTFNNFPLNIVKNQTSDILEPVIKILNTPPLNAAKGDRYIIWTSPINQWSNKDYSIAEYDGTSWTYIKPKNGDYLPIYLLGIGIEYIGYYPSGKWVIPEDTYDTLIKDLPNEDLESLTLMELQDLIEPINEQRNAAVLNDPDLLQLLLGD